jgi:hypothetical protein
LINAGLPCRESADFAKPIYSRQGNRNGVIGATISNADPNDRETWNELARESPTKGGKKERAHPASTEVA